MLQENAIDNMSVLIFWQVSITPDAKNWFISSPEQKAEHMTIQFNWIGNVTYMWMCNIYNV